MRKIIMIDFSKKIVILQKSLNSCIYNLQKSLLLSNMQTL
jgi:hypothetical protein